MTRICNAIILFMLLIPISSAAQSVGVVMSGGGAKGLYHIGVLRALEENGIPIDYIAGTSMGSIIGGMYASGYAVEEMEEVTLSGDMERWVSGGIDHKYNYFFIERDKINSIISLPVATTSHRNNIVSPRLILPGSMMRSSEIDLALCNFFTQPSAAARNNFSQLMIPFFCVATDIDKHCAVELHSGNLALAIRASMALPVAFSPVEIDSVVMCDGGCYDNFPWRALDNRYNPDIIIGSSCVNTAEKITLNSSVIEQAMALITKPTDFNLPADRSVFIQRGVDASVLDFSRAKEIMAAGYNDAIAAMPKIRALVTRRMTAEEFKERRQRFRSEWPDAKMGTIAIEGLNPRQFEMAEQMMHTDHNQHDTLPLTAKQMSKNYLTMLANMPLTSEFPSIVHNPSTNRYDVALRLQTKPNLDILIGGNISSTAFNQAYIGLRYQLLGRVVQSFDVDALLGPVYTLARVMGRTIFTTRKPIYLYYGYNFNINNTLKGNFGNITPVDNAEQMRAMENFVTLSFGSALSRKSVADVTMHTGRNTYSYNMGEYEKREYTHFSFVGSEVSFERASFNKPLYPTSGSRLDLSAIYLYGRDKRDSRGHLSASQIDEYVNTIRQWGGVKVLWEQYFDVTHNGAFSWGYALEGVYTTHPQFDSPVATELSSPQYAPLVHSRMVYMPAYRANYYVGMGVMPTVRIVNNLYARLSVYGMFRERYNDSLMHYMSDFSLIYHTPLGPVSLSLTKYDFSSKNNLYLTFNFGYAIIGKKGLFY